MNIWRTTGSTSLVRSDNPELSVGTSRHPSSICPSLATARSISCSHAMRDAGSRGREGPSPHPYWPTAGSVETLPPATRAEEKHRGSWNQYPPRRHLCSGVGACRSAMRVRFLRILQRLRDNRVAFFAFDVRNKAQPTGVVLVRGIIQTLTCRRLPGASEAVVFHEVLFGQLTGAAAIPKTRIQAGRATPWREPFILARLLHRGNRRTP